MTNRLIMQPDKDVETKLMCQQSKNVFLSSFLKRNKKKKIQLLSVCRTNRLLVVSCYESSHMLRQLLIICHHCVVIVAGFIKVILCLAAGVVCLALLVKGLWLKQITEATHSS